MSWHQGLTSNDLTNDLTNDVTNDLTNDLTLVNEARLKSFL